MSLIQPFNRIHIGPKLAFGMVLGGLTTALFWQANKAWVFNILVGWDVFCLSSIILFWITFFSIDSRQIREEVQVLNTNTPVIFMLAVSLILASLAIILLLFTQKTATNPDQDTRNIIIGFGGLLLSWTLFHTLFTIHYAHAYYQPVSEKDRHIQRGLQFPEEEHPDYLDFAYFSFVNGMTFQVSDVSVTDKRMRILVLFHCLLAFGFNTFIVALSINLIAGLM
ncbi:hypothetical protein D3C71_73970 [compost metagenome]